MKIDVSMHSITGILIILEVTAATPYCEQLKIRSLQKRRGLSSVFPYLSHLLESGLVLSLFLELNLETLLL